MPSAKCDLNCCCEHFIVEGLSFLHQLHVEQPEVYDMSNNNSSRSSPATTPTVLQRQRMYTPSPQPRPIKRQLSAPGPTQLRPTTHLHTRGPCPPSAKSTSSNTRKTSAPVQRQRSVAPPDSLQGKNWFDLT